MFRSFALVMLLGSALVVMGCGSKDQQNELVQQGNDIQQSTNKKPDTLIDAVAQKNKDNQQIYNVENDNFIEYTLNAPTSKLVVKLPSHIEVNLTPYPTNYSHLQGWLLSSHGTDLPEQGDYMGVSHNEDKLSMCTSYASVDSKMVEEQIGQPFAISIDDAACSFASRMKKMTAKEIAVEKITVDGLDARLVTMKHMRIDGPSIQKTIYISMNDDLWEVKFTCKDDGTDDVKELKIIEEIIKGIKLY